MSDGEGTEEPGLDSGERHDPVQQSVDVEMSKIVDPARSFHS